MRILAVVLILAAIVAAESDKNSSASKGTTPPVIISSGRCFVNSCSASRGAKQRRRARRGRKTLPHELRTLPHASAQISAKNDGNYRSSHAGASPHHG